MTDDAGEGVVEPGPDGAAAPGPALRRRGAFSELVVLVGGALLLALLVRTFVAQAFFIPSESMVPQLEIGDRVLVSRLAYDLHDPNRGDVVVFDSPYPTEDDDPGLLVGIGRGVLEAVGLRQQSTQEFVKRVVGLPGETVEGRDGHVFVDGRELEEPYLPEGDTTADFAPVQVPEGQLWVMGDNRSRSADSRTFGPVDEDTVVGRAVLRVWPPSRAAFL